jgi:hypothetical protein
MILTAPTRLAPFAFALGISLAAPIEQAEAGDFFFHRGFHHSTVVTTRGQTLNLAPVSTNTLTLTPATTLQLAPTTITGQTLHLAPQTLRLVGGTTSGSTLTFTVQNPGGQTLNLGSGTNDIDAAYQTLSLGFGNNAGKVVRLEQALNDKLDTLSRGVGDVLSDVDLNAILVDTAKGFLNSNGFASVIGDLEPVLGKVVSKVIANRRARRNRTQPAATRPDQDTEPTPDEEPAAPTITPAPSGGGRSFTISGRIILTPDANGPASAPPVVSSTPIAPDTPNPPNTSNAPITPESGVTSAPVIP